MTDVSVSNRPRVVRIAPDVLCQTVEGQAVLLNLVTERYHSLDEVGTRAWSLLAADGDVERAIAVLLQEYEVDEAVLRADLDVLLVALSGAGLLHVATC